jgi:hypothetical protein
VEDALDLVEHLFTSLAVELAGLAQEEILHLGEHAVGVGTVPGGHTLDPGGGVAACAFDITLR